jgi:LuxR family maltose regulon positive regulatory protein
VANGQLETAMGYAQEAGDVDRAAKLFEQCGPLVYQSGRVATTERWLGWLEAHGAMERNAAVAALGAAVASTWGRPAEAERLFEAAERASYEGSLPDGSTSVDSWLAIVRAQLCRRGVARMGADAEYAVRTLARGSFNRPNAALQLAFSQWLAGEVDQADDLFAEVAEEGLKLGTLEAAALAARRARRDRDRARDVGPGRRVGGAGARDHPPRSDGGVPQQRVRLGGGGARRASR